MSSAVRTEAATITSAATGNWSATATWVGGVVPTSSDDVIIANGHTVTVNGTYSCLSLSVATGNAAGAVLIGANTLTVSGATTINLPTSTPAKYIQITTGTFNTASLSIVASGNDARDSYLHINGTGTVNVTGNLSMSGSGVRSFVLFGSDGTLNIGGSITTSGFITSTAGGSTSVGPTTGTVNYNNNGNQNIGAYRYFNLITSGSGTKTLAGAINLGGNLTVKAGTTLALGANTLGATNAPTSVTLENGSSASTISGSGALTLGGDITVNQIASGSNGAVISCPVALGATRTFTVASAGSATTDLTMSGAISGTNFGITKAGAGALTLSGTNTFGGAGTNIAVNEGSVIVSSFGNNFGNASNSFSLGNASTSGTIKFSSVTGSVARNFTVGTAGGTLENTSSGAVTFSSAGSLNGNLTCNVSGASGSIIFSGVLSGTAGVNVNNAQTSAAVILTNSANTYTGNTTITSGELRLNPSANAIFASKIVLNGGTLGTTGIANGRTFTSSSTLLVQENSTIALAAVSHSLTFASSASELWTSSKTVTISGWTTTAGSAGTNGRIFFTNNTGLTESQLSAFTFSGFANTGAEFVSAGSSGELTPVSSATITSAQTGNWNNTSTWVGGVVPTSVDNAVITSNHVVTVTANASCKSIKFTGTAAELSVNSGITLSVTQDVSVNQSATQNNAGTVSGLGTINCASVNVGATTPSMTAARTTTLTSAISTLTSTGSLTLTSRDFAGFKNDPYFYLQSGTFTCTGVTTVHPVGTNVAVVSLANGAQTGTLILTGTTPFTLDTDGTNTITLNGSGATVNYAALGNQTVRNTPYTNLTLSGSGNKTLSAFALSGTLSVEGSAVGITTAPSFGASSTLQYRNVGTRTTNAIEWPSSNGPSNLIVDNNGSTLTMLASAARSLTGTLTLAANSTLSLNGNTLTAVGISSNSTSVIQNGNASTASTLTINNTSNFTYSGSLINGAAATLALTKQGAGSLTLSGANTHTGNTTISAGSLALSGSGAISSSNIFISSGATFDVSAKTTNVGLNTSQVLSIPSTGSNASATLTVGSDDGLTLSSAGGIAFTAYGGGSTAPLTVAGSSAGAIDITAAPVTVTTTTALPVGNYKLIAKSGSASGVIGTAGSLTTNGSGIGAGLQAELTVESGELMLNVCSILNITGTLSVCMGSTRQLTGSGTPNASNPWTSSNTSVATISSGGLVTPVAAGTTTITYRNNGGCSVSVTFTVHARPTPTFTVSPSNVCSDVDVTYTTQTGQSNYVWSVPGTLNTDYSITSGGIGTSSNSVTLKWLTGGQKTVTVNYDNTNGCNGASAASNTITVTASLGVVGSISGTSSQCAGLTGQIYNLAVPDNVNSYSWTVPSGWTITAGQGTNQIQVTVGSSGQNGNVSVTVNGANGCGSESRTFAVTSINCTSPTLSVSPLTAFGDVCIGSVGGPNSFTITGTSLDPGNISVGALSGYTYSTTSGGTYTSTLTLNQGGGAYSQDIFVKFTPTAAQSYNGNIAVSGGGATTVNAAASGTGIAIPAAPTGSASQTFCSSITPSIADLTATGSSIQWYAGSSGGSPLLSVDALTNATIYYASQTVNGCESTSRFAVTATVNPYPTVGAASSTPTLCINTALTNITHSTTIVTGIGTPSGLPNGVTAAWAGGVLTISGTPSQSGIFNYSIPLTGACASINATGTITVTAANTAGVPSSSPTLCINTPLTNITHSTTGATGISNSGVAGANGLPPGVSAVWSGGTITISGTPTSSATYNYSIPLTGGCGSVNATGTITVTAANTAGAASSTPTLCINTALTNITHTTSGATGIGAATGLPAGVTAAWASNTITISGTPTANGTFNYSIPLTGGCGTVNATGTINVTAANTVGSASSSPTLCINTPLNAITHTTTVATGIGTASGLPAGVTASWSANTITISGTPAASGTFNYSIPLTGGCGSVNAIGTINVSPASVAGTASADQSICSGGSPANITLSGSTGTIQWQVSSNNVSFSDISGATSATLTSAQMGTLTATRYYRAVVTSGSCSSATSNAITVTVTGAVAIGNTTYTICSGGEFTFAPVAGDVVPNGTTYTWTYPTINPVSTITGGSESPSTQTGSLTVVTYTTPGSGSWTPPAGVTNVTIEVMGGGGAGGGQNQSSDGGGGGGGGAYSRTDNMTVSPNNSYSYSVGSGGSGVAAQSGTDGGDSWFGTTTTVMAKGGTGGAPSTGAPPVGGLGGAASSGFGVTKFSGGQGEKGRDNATGLGGYGGSSAGTASDGFSGPQTYSTNTYPTSSTPTGAGHGGNGGAASTNGSTPVSGYGGGGGGSGEGTNMLGGDGYSGYVKISYNEPVFTGQSSVSQTLTNTSNSSSSATYTVTASGCSTTDNFTITVNVTPTPTATISYAGPFCASVSTPQSVTFSGVSGGTYSASPSGLSINASTGAITPSTSTPGTYTVTYTIAAGGGCNQFTTTTTVTINPLNTVSAASASPTLCISTSLPSITHTTSGATGIGAPSGLPAGVTAAWASNTITISGNPTASGVFNYTIPLTGGCGNVSATGTITVTAANTASVPSSTPSLCINTPLTNITHSTTGATGIANSGVAGANGLPPGVSAVWSGGTITISGTPTSSATYNYSIPLTGGCGSVNATGTITVNPLNTVGAASSTPTLCINTPLTAITHTTSGATGIGAATGLPSGLNVAWASNTITISGTPTASGTFNYSIPLTGGCGTVNATGTINVTAANTVGSASSSPTLCIDSPLTAITHTTTGASGIGTTSGLPAGVTASWSANTITISGTPTASGTFNYTIPLTGGCGSVSATGTINVTAANTAAAPSSNPTLCVNTLLSPSVTISTTGATGIGVASNLPAGLTASWSGNVITISGTPTATGTFNYTIPLTGGCGNVNASGTITVNGQTSVGAASSTPTLCINSAMTAVTHATTNATGIGVASGLPAGVTASFAANTITISGTPTASGTFNYTIPVTGCGSVNATGTISVDAAPTAANAGSTQTICTTATATLAANNPSVGTGTWSVVSGPSTLDSQFSSTSQNNAVFTPAGGAGTYVLRWTISNGTCSPSTSNVTITVNAPPTTANAGPDQLVSGTTATLAGNTPSSGTGTWTLISGTASITSPSSPTTGVTGLAANSNAVLRWTVSSGGCTTSSDEMTISTSSTVTAAAPLSITTCTTFPTEYFLLGNIVITEVTKDDIFDHNGARTITFVAPTNFEFEPGVGSVSVSGPDISSASVAVTSSLITVTVNTNGGSTSLTDILTLSGIRVRGISTVTSNASITRSAGNQTVTGCITNTVVGFLSSSISAGPQPTTSNAGTDQVVLDATATLAGNTPSIGTGAWTVVSGTATITTPSSASSTVTGLVGGTSATLRWTTSNAGCISTDDVIVTRYCVPTYASGGTNDRMTNVLLGTLNDNPPANVAPYYFNRTAVQNAIPDLTEGTTSNLTLSFGSDANQYSRVWIDFNNNGTFETTESFSLGTNAGANGSTVIPINVPAGVNSGSTILRIRGADDAAITNTQACGASNSGFGQGLDYRVNIIGQTPCAGTPAPGAVSSTSPSACTNSFTLSLQVPLTNSGLTYQWQSSPDGNTWTNVSGATSPTLTTTLPGTANYYYRVRVTCGNSSQQGFSDAIIIFYDCSNYCASNAVSNIDSRINNVTLTAVSGSTVLFNNTSPNTCQAYTNYTSVSGTIFQGDEYQISVTAGSCNGQYTRYVNVYANWNTTANDNFTDAGELIAQFGPTNQLTQVFTGNFTVPIGADLGLSRLRIVLVETNSNANISPCGTYNYGETEDYSIVVCTRPTISAQPQAVEICAGDNTSFSVSASTPVGSTPLLYQWQVNTGSGYVNLADNSTYAGVSTGTLTVSNAAAAMNGYLYRCVLTNGCSGAISSSGVILTVRPTITASVSGTTTVCQSASSPNVTFTNPLSLPITITYNVNGGAAQTINVAANSTATVSQSTASDGVFTYNLVSAVYQTAPTCSAVISGSAAITVRPTITASISGTVEVCQNATSPNVTFTNPMALPITITYNVNGGSAQTVNVAANSTATVAQSTSSDGAFTYNLVSAVYQTAPSCSVSLSGSATITVRPTITATISGTTEVCQDATAPNVTFTNPLSLPITVTYTVNGGSAQTINVAGNSTATVSQSTASSGTFTYNLVSAVYQSAPTCSASLSGSATITVRPTITASISGTATVCQSSSAPDITFTNPLSLPITVTYNVNGGSAQTVNVAANSTATVSQSTASDGVFTYNLVSAVYQTSPTCSAVLSGSATITVLPTITASIAGTTEVCQNATSPNVTFTNPMALPITITYNVNGGSAQTVNIAANSSAIVSQATASSGTFTYNLVSAVYQSAPTCSSSLSGSASITVRPTITATISGTTDVCQDAASPNVTFTNPLSLPITVTYNVNGGSAQTVNVPANSSATVSQVTTSTGVFIYNLVSAVYQSAPTCSGSLSGSATITVNPNLPASVSITASTISICAGDNVTFTATPTNQGSSPVYQWKVNGSNVGTNSSSFSSTSLNNGDIVTCVLTSNASPCLTGSPATSNAITITVNPNLPASVSISASATTICAGEQVTFTAIPTNGGSAPSYQWQVNGSNVGTNSATFASTTLNNADIVTCILTSNASTCLTGSPATSNSLTITVNPLPNIVLINPASGSYCGSVLLTAANGSSGTIYWQGTTAGGTSTSTPSNTQTVTASGTYYFRARSAAGCWGPEGSATITITLPTITANAGPDQAQCGSGSFTLSGNIPSSGSGLWTVISGSAAVTTPSSPSSSVTGVPAGTSATLRWTVTDGPCSVFDEVILTNNAVPVMTSASALTICSGDDVGLVLTSSVSSSFVWVAGISSTVNGESTSNQSTSTITDVLTNVSTSALTDQNVTYTVTPTASGSGCPGNGQTVTITVRRPLMVAISGSQVACGATVNEVLTASATAGVTSYQWYLNGTAISGATSSTYTATANGTYSVEVSNAGGCSVTSGNYSVTLPSSLSVSVTGIDVTCSGANDGQATVTFTGGVNRKLINFDNLSNWVAGGAALSSYSNHSYNESDWVITAVDQGLQESMFPITQEPSVLGTYSWRLNSTPSTNHLLFTYNGTKKVSGFGFKARAYSIMPNWSVEYSTNGGTSWTAITPVINSSSLGNQNAWTNFDYLFPSPLSLATGQLKIRIIRQANSERIMVDDFYYSTTPEISWNTGATTATITGLTSGTYTATVTNINGCSVSSSVTIAAPTAINITETVTNVLCNGASTGSISVSVSGGVGPYTYSWSNGGAASSISGLSAGTYTVTVTDNIGCTATETYTISQPSAITATASATTNSLLCFGDQTTLTVTASGGTAPYTYSLNGGAYQSANSFTVGAGSYTVTVQDASNCQVSTNTVVITQPTLLSASISAGSIACFGGTTTLTVSASGGTTAYQYSLNGGAFQASNTFSVGAGTYTVTVKDANLCTQSTNTLTITEPAAVTSPTAGGNTPLCVGETLNLTATTVSGATYSWTGPNSFSSSLQNPSIVSATTSNSGTYQVIATVAGCNSSPATISVTVNPTPSITAQPVNISVNQGASSSFSVTASGSGVTYQWQYATAGAGPWNNVSAGSPSGVTYSGATGSTLTVNVGETTPTGSNYFYRCVVSIGSCSVTSSNGQMTVLIGNNTCAEAFLIETDGISISANLSGATQSICTAATDKDIWYYFTPTCSQSYTVSLTGLPDDKDLLIYQSPCPTSCVGSLYISQNTGTTPENITQTFSAGVTYYIRIKDYAGTGGNVSLAVTGPTPPVIVRNPIALSTPEGTSASFIVDGSNNNGVQWQLSQNGGSTWSNLANNTIYTGVATNQLTVSGPDLTMDQYLYRAEFGNITAGCPSRVTRNVKLNVWKANAGSDQTVCFGTADISLSQSGTIGTRLFYEDVETVNNFDGTGLYGWQLGVDAPSGSNDNSRGDRWSAVYNTSGANLPITGARSIGILSRKLDGTWFSGYNNRNIADIQAITPQINSTSYQNLQLTFNWKSNGEVLSGNPVDYGQVGYSTNGSTVTWFTTGGNANSGLYHSITANTPQTISLPSGLNNSSFYIHFRWVQNGNSAGSQSPFIIDDIEVTGTPVISYVWSGPGTIAPNTTSAQVTVNASGTFTGTIASVGGNSSDQVAVTILPAVSNGTVNSTSESICDGGDPSLIDFTILPAGATGQFNYQWYYRDGNNACPTGNNTTGWTMINGASSSSYDPPSGLNATRTYAVMIDPIGTPDCGGITWAGCRVVTVVPDPFITGQPLNTQTLCVGGTSTNLQAIASGGTPTLTYQWYSNVANSYTDAQLINGATSASYTPPTVTSGTIYYFCTVTAAGNGCNPINSSIAEVIVVPDPAISAQPLATQTVCTGGTLTALSVTASGGTPALTYQWYSSSTNAYAGSPITGATSATYTPSTASAVTTYYYCIVSASGNGCGSVNSQIAEVIVLSQPTVSSQPLASQTVCLNGTATSLSVSLTGGSSSFAYQWYSNAISSNSGGTPISGANANAYDPPSTSAGTVYYYCVITDNVSGCNDPVSNVAAVTVVINILITSQPANAPPVCQGGVGTFTVTATGGVAPISYQWQYFNGSSWNNVSNGTPTGAIYTGATSTSLSVSGITLSGTYDYRVIISSPGVGCVSATSNTASFTVVDPITITLNPVTSTTICAQGSVTYTVSGTGGTPSLNYTWQYKNPSSGAWVLPTTNPPAGAAFSGQGTSSFTISGITASGTWEYRCLLSASGSGCSNATSTTAFLTVVPDPSITSQPQANSTVCLNGSLTLSTIAANGTPSLSYQWYSNTSNSNTGGTPISGAISASYSVPTGMAGTFYYYCVVSASGNGCNDIATNVSVVTIINLTNSFTSTNVSCFGGNNGSIDLTVSGGFGYTYSWTGPNGFTSSNEDLSNLLVGTYNVTVTDANGCTTTTSVTITESGQFIAEITSDGPTTFCEGESVTLTASAGTSWLWSNGETTQSIEVSVSGNYSVTVVNENGCESTSSVTEVIVNDVVIPVISTSGPTTFCVGGQVTLIASSGQSYLWSNGSTNPSILVTQSGDFTVTVTDANGCQATSSITTVTVNPYPILQVNGVMEVCQGGSTVLTASGADTYIWSPSEILNTTVGNTVTVTPTALPGNPTTVTVTGIINGCEAETEAFIVVLAPQPVSVTITASDLSIIAGESVTFTSSVTNGGTAPTYQWFVNGSAISGATASTYTTSALQNGDDIWVVVTSNSTAQCLSNNPATSNTLIIEVVDCQIGEILGDQILCGYSQASFTIEVPPCVTSYSWSLPDGLTIVDEDLNVPGFITIDVTIDQVDFVSGQIVFNATYNGGSASAILDVTQAPFTPEFLTTSSCGLPNTTVTFEVVEVPGVDTYTWTPPTMSTILFGQATDSVRVKFASQFNSGMLSVVATNLCGSSPAAEFFILAPPARPVAILGSNTACTAVPSQLYRVDSVAHASYYIWGMPTGATIISTPITNDSINVMFQNFTSGVMSVKSANECGSSTMRYLTVSTPSIAAATSITGPQSVCSYAGTGQTISYTTPSVNGVTYIWSVPSGATIVSGSGTNTIGVQFAAGFTGGSLGVVLSNGCSLSQPTTMQLAGVSGGGSPLPIPINGLTSVCSVSGSTTTYSVSPPVGANGYTWTVPSGVSIVSGQNSSSIIALIGTGFNTGTLSVSITTICGATYQQSITLTKVPSGAGSVAGPTCITTGSAYTYSISAVSGATSYQWSAPTNASIVSGQGTATVTVQFASNFNGGNVSVIPSNACGSGSSASVAIGLTPVIPSQIIGPTTACPGDILTYSSSAPGASSYIWGLPVGMSFVPNTSQSGSSIQVVVDAAFITGVISVKSVTGCGSSTMRYSNLISNAGCASQLVIEDTGIINSEIESYSVIEKAYISDAVNGNIQFAFDNSLGISNIEVVIVDTSGNAVYRTYESTVSGYNSFNFDLSYLDHGSYLFIVKDEEQHQILRKEIRVEGE